MLSFGRLAGTLRNPARLRDRVFVVPLAVIAIFIAVVAYGASRLEGGYDGAGGPNTFFVLIAVVWTLAVATRRLQPGSPLATAVETLTLFFALSILAAFSSASLAIGSGPFVDASLVAIDRALFPFLDWQALVLWLSGHPDAHFALSVVYDSMNWQPFAFILVAALFGKAEDQERFIGAWAIGLALCILPFHWFPALSPYNYFAITPEEMPGATVAMPWHFLPIMEGLRDGSIQRLSVDTVSGMVTIPSFHAAAATILAGSFWRFRLLRWPMLGLNIGMALAAVPIGSHYIVDILAGIACGVLALAISGSWATSGFPRADMRDCDVVPTPAMAQ